MTFLKENGAGETSSHRKFHSEAHVFSWVEWVSFGGPAGTGRELVVYEGLLAAVRAEIAVVEAEGQPVPAGLRERLSVVERLIAGLRAQLDGLPPAALRDPRAERDAEVRAWGAADDDARAVIERRITTLTEEVEARDVQLEALGALAQRAGASAVHALMTSLSVYIAGPLAQRMEKLLALGGRLFEMFPGRIPTEVEVIARLAQRGEALSFALGGDGPRAEPAAILAGLRPGVQRAVVSRVLWKMKMAYSPGDFSKEVRRHADPGGTRREEAYHESGIGRAGLGGLVA